MKAFVHFKNAVALTVLMISAIFGATAASAQDGALSKVRADMVAAFGPTHAVLIPGETYMGGNHTVVHCVASVSDYRLWNFSKASLVKGYTCDGRGKMKNI